MAKKWRETIGPHGAKVTVEERTRGGNVQIKTWDPELNGYRKRSLGYPVRDEEGELVEEATEKARKAARKVSDALLKGGYQVPTVSRVVRLFRREAVPDMSEKHRREVARDLNLLLAFLGGGFNLGHLGPREWNAIRRQRASGEVDAKGQRVPAGDRREVSPRTVAKTLKTLRQLCRFATEYRTEGGEFLLDVDPTRGLDLPKEKNPSQPVASDERVEKMLEAAPKVHAYMRDLLTLAAETGRRIGAILALRYSDWLPDVGTYGAIRWRADSDKIGEEWVAPISPTVQATLRRIIGERPGFGDAYLFPAEKSDGPVDVTLVSRWWRKCEKAAKLEHKDRGGWHMLRRRWATKRKGLPVQDGFGPGT